MSQRYVDRKRHTTASRKNVERDQDTPVRRFCATLLSDVVA